MVRNVRVSMKRKGEEKQQEIRCVEDADGGGIETEPLPENGACKGGKLFVVEPKEDEPCEKKKCHKRKKTQQYR